MGTPKISHNHWGYWILVTFKGLPSKISIKTKVFKILVTFIGETSLFFIQREFSEAAHAIEKQPASSCRHSFSTAWLTGFGNDITTSFNGSWCAERCRFGGFVEVNLCHPVPGAL